MVADRAAIIFLREYPGWMHQLAGLFLKQGAGHLEAEDFHPAGGGAGAGADQHQEDEEYGGEMAPQAEVGQTIARGGQHRNDVEQADADGIG